MYFALGILDMTLAYTFNIKIFNIKIINGDNEDLFWTIYFPMIKNITLFYMTSIN